MKTIRLLLADDHFILRSGLKKLLDEQADMKVVAEAADCDETIARVAEVMPDVLLLDLNMPGPGGIKVIRHVKATWPEIVILVLTMHEEEQYFTEALKAGAAGYVPKKAADTELIAAIRAVTRGELYVHSSFTRFAFNPFFKDARKDDSPEPDLYNRLSQREQGVLKAIAEGYTNQQIAANLFLSVKTVETYKARIMEKLAFRSRAELVRFALERGILT